MQSKATTIKQYLDELPPERVTVIKKIRAVIKKNIPKGFVEQMSYGMIGYVVPFSLYPSGYRANPKLPLPFANLASQKNYIALYHMGVSADKKLLQWFREEYKKTGWKLDMGVGCIRFKNLEQIPYELIGKLFGKITVEKYIEVYDGYYARK